MNLEDPQESPAPGAPWQRHLTLGPTTALVVSAAVALGDWLALTTISVGAEVPVDVELGTVGRVLAIHAISVLPLLLALAGLLAWLTTRLSLTRPEGPQLAASVAVAGLVVGYGSLAQKDSLSLGPLTLTAAHMLPITGVAALTAWGLAALLARWLGPSAYRRLLLALSAPAALLFLAAPLLVRGTPLAGPAAYRAEMPQLRTPRRDRADTRPDVLFIVLDTVRADRLSHHGHTRDTTPFLAELASRGVTFDRAISPGNYTYPAHASMFTGLAVREHGIGAEPRIERLDSSLETFAERAAASGYQTKAFSCNPWVDDPEGLLQGFESTTRTWGTWQWSSSFLHHWLLRLGWEWPADWIEVDCGAAMQNRLAAEWVRGECRPEQPYLAFFNYMEAHRDQRPPRAWRRLFLDEEQVARSYELERDADVLVCADSDYWIVPEGTVSEADLEVSLGLYDASLRYQDDRLRELFGLFEASGLLENTVVIVVSDHGEGFGEHGIFQHHSSVHDVLVHVPLTIVVPHRPIPGRRVSDAVSTTFLHDLVDAVVSGEVPCDAGALAELLLERSGASPVVAECQLTTRMAEVRAPAFGIEPGTGILRTFRAVTDDRFKFILASDGQAELFDIDADPGEALDLAGARPELVEAYSRALEAWLAERRPRYSLEAAGAAGMDSRRRSMLESLGYTGGDDEDLDGTRER
jgi:arylsulfatase A-like enzyme